MKLCAMCFPRHAAHHEMCASNNEIITEWEPGPIYVVQSLWDPGGPSYTS